MEYAVRSTFVFKRVHEKLELDEQLWIKRVEAKLAIAPTGTILRYSWFREKKYWDKRLFFLVDEQQKKVLFVAFASKKEQQKIIDYVIDHKEEFFKELRRL